MKKLITVIILHGAYSAPTENWFPWLAHQLEKKGYVTYRPSLPTPQGQSLEAWKKIFFEQFPNIDSNTILVGHSAAPAFILNILQSINTPIKGIILVSPFVRPLGLVEFDSVNKTFFKGPFDWDLIRKNAGQIEIFGGDNDPYVPVVAMQEVADHLNSQLKLIKDGKHLNASAGYKRFPEVLKAIINISN